MLQSVPPIDDAVAIPREASLSEEDKELLHIYHSSFNDDNIDIDLLMSLLIQIHCNQPRGYYCAFDFYFQFSVSSF